MWKKDFPVSLWSFLVICLSSVACSGWKPIAPPMAYYGPQQTPCVSDCDLQYKSTFTEDAGGSPAETQLKSTSLNQPKAFNQATKDYHQINQKLDLDIFKPTEVTFFPAEQGKTFNSPLSTYQEVFRQTPTSFFSFKTYGLPQKPSKTIYYGDHLELAKPKLSSDIKYYKPYKHNPSTVFKPGSLFDNEVGSYRPLKGSNSFDDHCSLYKVSFKQDPFYQYIQYKVHMPELKEFTLCLWSRFHNHSLDHSLFSYAVKNHPKAIYMWVSNLNDPGYFSVKIMGQTIFRLNFPIKLYHWFHVCQSWNGNTGEWQVWVNSHRIARGYHNLLVGHSIPGGGVALSGQEHRHFGKGFQEIPHYLKGTGGLEGEVTMLQLYKVALTAGKAYNDHSYHHSHYTSTTTEPPEFPTEEASTTTDHPFLENGQLKKHINVLELAEAFRNKGHLETHKHRPYVELYGEPVHPHPYVPLPVHGNTLNYLSLPNHVVFKRNDESKPKKTRDVGDEEIEIPEKIKFLDKVSGQVQVEKVKYSTKIDEVTPSLPEMEPRRLNLTSEESAENFTGIYDDEDQSGEEKTSGLRVGRTRRHHPRRNRPKRISPGEVTPSRYLVFRPKKHGNNPKLILKDEKAAKRQIVFEEPFFNFGHDAHSTFGGIHSSGLSYDHFSQFAQDFSEDIDQMEEDHLGEPEKERKKEVELAEGEVKRIMEICSGCQSDPFRKVAVISWRSTPKKMFSGALFLKAKSQCDHF